MIKALIPSVHTAVCDRAMQVFGAIGLSPDTPLTALWTFGRVLRIADGPDEVHMRTVARQEVKAALTRRGETMPFLATPVR